MRTIINNYQKSSKRYDFELTTAIIWSIKKNKLNSKDSKVDGNKTYFHNIIITSNDYKS